MTFKDFFHLNDEQFKDRISKLSDEELMKQDIHNCRTIHSGGYGAAIGAVEAVPTMGVSLVGSAIGLRRRDVAKQRLKMVHDEIKKRGLTVHKQTKRDYLIPLGIAGVSMGVGDVAMAGLGALPVVSLAGAAVDVQVAAGSQVAQEAAGKLGVEMASDHAIDRRMPGTGRGKEWAAKLSRSHSASSLQSGLAPPSTDAASQAISAPSSPLLAPKSS